MEQTPSRRDKAIKTSNERIDAANKRTAEREAKIRAQELRRQKLYEDWPKLADGVIADTVKEVNNVFVQHGSPIGLVLASAPATVASSSQRQSEKQVKMDATPRAYDVRNKGQPQPIARLQFEIDISTGKITATSTMKVSDLPPPVLIEQCDAKWAAAVAESILLAVLEG